MRLLVLAFLGGLGVFAAAGWWLHEPLRLKLPAGAQVLDLEIEPGTPAQGVAAAVAASGVDVLPDVLYAWFRLSGQARQIKAGSYEITPGATPQNILQMLARGEEALRSVTLVEGWTDRKSVV